MSGVVVKPPARVQIRRAGVWGPVGQLIDPPLLPGPNRVLIDHEFPSVLVDAVDIQDEPTGGAQ